MLGVAAFSFAFDRAWSSGPSFKVWLPTRAMTLVMCLIVVGMLGLGCGALSPLGRMAWRLETLAARDYAERGMYKQAGLIFDYIYAHPSELLGDNTRLSHAELLLEADEAAEARRMLALAIEERPDDAKAASGEILRRTGELYARLVSRGGLRRPSRRRSWLTSAR